MTHFFALLLLLTRNEMAVVRAWTPAGAARISGTGYSPAGAATASPAAVPHLRCLAIAAVRFSTGRNIERPDGWHPVCDPMEAALSTFAMRAGVSLDELSSSQVERRFPFEPRRRRASVVADGLLQVKGARTLCSLAACRSRGGRSAGRDDRQRAAGTRGRLPRRRRTARRSRPGRTRPRGTTTRRLAERARAASRTIRVPGPAREIVTRPPALRGAAPTRTGRRGPSRLAETPGARWATVRARS
jgi:magnesium-transporting ATPase (P-type)